MIKIRKADKNDLNQIEKIYNHIHLREEKGLTSIGWIRNVYPTLQTAQSALERNDLFVMESGEKIVACAVINQIQVDVYRLAKWKFEAKDSEVMVLHTLAVEPDESGKGYGKAFVKYYENYARENNCFELRIDTNKTNTLARKMYEHLGFEETGTVTCNFNNIPNVSLICLEKHID